MAKRGANEIGSCLYHHLRSEDCKSEHIFFYSDNCVGQNKNKFVFSLYLFCVLNIDKVKTITHMFLVKGHTQNEGDSVHACIEKEKNRLFKSGPIYVPAQWATVIRSARKRGTPYKVNEIDTKDIFDLKTLCAEMGENYVKNTENEKVIWKNVKIVKVSDDLVIVLKETVVMSLRSGGPGCVNSSEFKYGDPGDEKVKNTTFGRENGPGRRHPDVEEYQQTNETI
ncbi:hypothetical protein QE152_g24365 [Popillia japonica]|uniref:DUF7869 domain-containing protein n=1 Tax=Popillia japonica TaxID=7064 RepID=A0AAW1KGR4_POPJA